MTAASLSSLTVAKEENQKESEPFSPGPYIQTRDLARNVKLLWRIWRCCVLCTVSLPLPQVPFQLTFDVVSF